MRVGTWAFPLVRAELDSAADVEDLRRRLAALPAKDRTVVTLSLTGSLSLREKAVLDDLLAYGRPNKPARPWLGLYATEDESGLVVTSMARSGPAMKAGIQEGDRVLAVGDLRVSDLAGLWRAVWASGAAGCKVRLGLSRDGTPTEAVLTSADRRSFLKAPRLH